MDFNSLFPYDLSDDVNIDASFPSTYYLNGDDDSPFPLSNNFSNQLNADVSLPPRDYLNAAAADASLVPNHVLGFLNAHHSLLSTNFPNTENSLPLPNHLNADVSQPSTNYLSTAAADASFIPNDMLGSFNVDQSLLSSNFENAENSLPFLDHPNVDDASPVPDDVLNSLNVDHSLLSTNFSDAENSLPLPDHLNADISQPSTSYLSTAAADASFIPNDMLGSFNVDQSLPSANFLDAENSLPLIDFLNSDSSLPWTYNFNTGNLLPSTDHPNTQNSFPPTNLLSQSDSLDRVQGTSISSLALNMTDPMTQMKPPESQFGTNFSLFTNDQDKRLSISTMPIISHHGTSFREEFNGSDLRRHTITELMPSQLCQTNNHSNSNFSFNVDFQANSRTNLKSYLSEYDLVPTSRAIQFCMANNSIPYTWLDIGQIREWESFSLEEFSKINSLQYLLERDLPKSGLPTPSINSSTSDHNGEYFAAKINAALSQFQGHRHLKIQVRRDEKTNEEIFLSSCDEYSSPDGKKGRIVGLRMDRFGLDLIWGRDAPKLKQTIAYLECLAELHYYLREYGCRYGYILTDVNLIVVRHGTEKTPNFGFLETKIFPLNPSRRPNLTLDGEPSEFLSKQMRRGLVQEGPALLALWYLHMLAGDIIVPGHVGWDINTGSYSDKSKHRFLARDADLVKILDADVRKLKRRRRWTTPWQVKPPRSKHRSERRSVSIQQEKQTPKMTASEKDPTRGIIKINSEAVSKKVYGKPFKNVNS